MTAPAAMAQVNAKLDVRPTHSQSFLVTALILACLLTICSMFLLIFDQQIGGYLFISFAVVVALIGFQAWKKSQPDVDMEDSHPTCISLPDGTHISTDSRTLRSIDGLQGMAKLCSELVNRKPLPIPDGLVDASVQPIPDSQAEAIDITNMINTMTQSNTNALIDVFGRVTTESRNGGSDLRMQNSDVAAAGPDQSLTAGLNVVMDD